jgi:hypothetical protein
METGETEEGRGRHWQLCAQPASWQQAAAQINYHANYHALDPPPVSLEFRPQTPVNVNMLLEILRRLTWKKGGVGARVFGFATV